MSAADRPRTLVLVSHTDQFSGAEAVLSGLVDHAVEQGRRVVLAAPPGAMSERLPDGVGHLAIPLMGLRGGGRVARALGVVGLLAAWTRGAVALRPAVCDPGTDVVVNSTMALPAVRLAAPLRRGTCTWLVHDTVRERKQRVVVSFAARAVRRAVAVSEATARSLRGFGFPVSVRVNGVEPVADPAPVSHPGRPVVGMLGTLTPWKGQDVLLAAAAAVPEVDVELAGRAMPGDEEYVAGLEAAARSPGLLGRVRLLGHVDPAERLRAWTLLVSASVLPEAGPLGAIEAMAAGCPVIGTEGGYVTVDRPCVVVPRGDPDALAQAIRELVADPGRRAELAEAGRELVTAHHDRNRTVPAMFEELTTR